MKIRSTLTQGTSWILVATASALLAIAGCGGGQNELVALAAERDMSPEDAARAIKSFVPPGKHDEYLLFASGGHSDGIAPESEMRM